MKILFIDIDTLRADHLGCYGYERNTSPNIDAVAKDGLQFMDYYCSDAPCLPSRSASFTGKFGIHTGIVGHGGTAADMRPEGCMRGMSDQNANSNLPAIMWRYGMYPVTISSFAERHGAWWFQAGFKETYNPGNRGNESADKVTPTALDWLQRNKARNDWFLHVQYWDPHTKYRTPKEFGNPFKGQDSSSISWITQEILDEHKKQTGFHSASEMSGYTDRTDPNYPRQLGKITCLDDVRYNVDSYDCGVAYADMHVGKIIDELKKENIYDDVAIIITADHGEDIGELGSYDEHGAADYPVTHIPLIIKWPGATKGIALHGLHYNIDLLPTLISLLGNLPIPPGIPKEYRKLIEAPAYDGSSFANCILEGKESGREYLVVSQCAHVCQRSVRFGDYIYIKTYHDGYCLYDDEMLFNVKDDPHEIRNLAEEKPELCYKAVYFLDKWYTEQMKKQPGKCQIDPLWTVMAEGGPFYARWHLPAYLKRLDATGRKEAADKLRAKHPDEL